MQRLTKEQAAILGAYTGILLGKISDMHEYIEKIMNRPVYTHEMSDIETMKEVKKRAYSDLMLLINKKIDD